MQLCYNGLWIRSNTAQCAHAHIRLATMGYGLEHYCACAYQRDSAVVSTTVQCALAVLKYAVYYKHHCA